MSIVDVWTASGSATPIYRQAVKAYASELERLAEALGVPERPPVPASTWNPGAGVLYDAALTASGVDSRTSPRAIDQWETWWGSVAGAFDLPSVRSLSPDARPDDRSRNTWDGIATQLARAAPAPTADHARWWAQAQRMLDAQEVAPMLAASQAARDWWTARVSRPWATPVRPPPPGDVVPANDTPPAPPGPVSGPGRPPPELPPLPGAGAGASSARSNVVAVILGFASGGYLLYRWKTARR